MTVRAHNRGTAPPGRRIAALPDVSRPRRTRILTHYVENVERVMDLIQGQDTTCPHCGEPIQLTLDLSVPEQSYIEDCPVCCKPMAVSYTAADGEVTGLSVEAAD